MEFAILATGSRGNALAVRCAGEVLLVDAGLSGREITRRLAHLGVPPGDVRGILLSHAHTDHVRGAGVLTRRYGWAIFGTPETLCAVEERERLGEERRAIAPGQRFRIAGFSVRAYPTPHDAAGSVQYLVRSDGHTLAVATDIGEETPAVRKAVASAGAVLLEANHDPIMLRDGPYPTYLKRRIAGPEGHLSNEAAGALLAGLGERLPRLVVLGHMSEVNNRPEIARRTVENLLGAAGLRAERLDAVPQGVMRNWTAVPRAD